MKNINLENAWCKTTQENYDALINLGYKPSDNITNAFRNDFETHLRIKSDIIGWGHKKCIGAMENPDYWSKDREIHLVNGEFEYVEIKPKNNFKDYGFEADFEGEILKEYDDCYIGSILNHISKNHMEGKWDKKGYSKHSNKWNLKPIKKEWYENPDNFPCIVMQINCIDDRELDCGHIIFRNIDDFNRFGGDYRHLTKEEVLALLVKE